MKEVVYIPRYVPNCWARSGLVKIKAVMQNCVGEEVEAAIFYLSQRMIRQDRSNAVWVTLQNISNGAKFTAVIQISVTHNYDVFS
jgi:hypothetical protein